MDLFNLLLAAGVVVFFIGVLIRMFGPPKISRVRHNEPMLGDEPVEYAGDVPADGRSMREARSRPISLTRRQLEHVNIQRKIAGRAALNRKGFRAAVSIAGSRNDPRQQPDDTSSWLTYLILYECFFSDHQSHRVGVNGGVTIFPTEPYNGQGSGYTGAGASGNWGAPDALALGAAALAASTAPTITDLSVNGGAGYTDAPAGSVAGDVVSDRSDAQSYSAPAPEYTAPSPSPSYDSGSSFDSGSSSSSGGDGGGGGGGGGD